MQDLSTHLTSASDPNVIDKAKANMQQVMQSMANQENHPYVSYIPSLGFFYASNLPSIPSERMTQFELALGKFDHSDEIDFQIFRDTTSQSVHVLSNEVESNLSLDFLSTCEFRALPADKIRVACLVGESNFLSIMSSVVRHVQHIMIVDIDPLILAHCEFMLECLRQCDNLEAFNNRYFDASLNPALKAKIKTGRITVYDGNSVVAHGEKFDFDATVLARLIKDKTDAKNFGEKYFCANNDHYRLCHALSKAVSFSFVQCDLFNQEHVVDLKRLLDKENAEITLFNLTNLILHDNDKPMRAVNEIWEHKGRLLNNLKLLVKVDSVIPTLFSTYYHGEHLLLKCKQAMSVQDCFSQTQQNIFLTNISIIGTKYEFKDDNLDFNKLFRAVAGKGEQQELDYLLRFYYFLREESVSSVVARNLSAKFKFDINGRGAESGRTALHFAVINGRFDNVNLLLGCSDIKTNIKDSVTKSNKRSRTAGEYAKGDIKTLFLHHAGCKLDK